MPLYPLFANVIHAITTGLIRAYAYNVVTHVRTSGWHEMQYASVYANSICRTMHMVIYMRMHVLARVRVKEAGLLLYARVQILAL